MDAIDTTPALTFLATEQHRFRWDLIINGCSECPFAQVQRLLGGGLDYNPADPDEGNYLCALLGKEVWGENPECGTEDWQKRIKQELEALKK